MNSKNIDVLRKILYAVETGGQVYGRQRYDAFIGAGANTPNEKAITIGAGQWYAGEAKRLLLEIQRVDPVRFGILDTQGIADDLKNKDWSRYAISPTSAKAKCIVSIISSSTGIRCQDWLMETQIKEYAESITKTYGAMPDTAMMECINIIHQGGAAALKRILGKTKKPYTSERIYAALCTDPADKSNNNQVGDYTGRQKKVIEMIRMYAEDKEVADMSLWNKTKELLDNQVGYLEKRSNANLDSKTANAGYGNYTKYSRDVNNMGLMGCQGQPWCATYQFWGCAKIFGKAKALEIMGNGFYNCNSVKAHSRLNGTWHSTPKLGALVIFRNGAHIGRVIRIANGRIYTNEGNTSSGGLNNVEANGGCVAEKVYTVGNSQIDGYVWIDYGAETESGTEGKPWKATGTATATVDNLFVRTEPNGEVIGELMKGNRFEINGIKDGSWTQVKVAGIGVGYVWTDYIQADGTPSTKPPKQEITNKQDKTERLYVGKVTANILNVRTWAGTEYPQIKSYPTLEKGNLVDVMNFTQTAVDGGQWYYIRIAGKYYGFVSAQYIVKK